MRAYLARHVDQGVLDSMCDPSRNTTVNAADGCPYAFKLKTIKIIRETGQAIVDIR